MKINGVTYNGVRKNSLAWYLGKTLKAIGYFMWLLTALTFVLLVVFIMLVIG